MKALERLKLLEDIGCALQSKMTFAEIDRYLKVYGVDLNKPTSGRNSKRIYSKEMLEDVPESMLIEIAEELEVAYEISGGITVPKADSHYWIPGYFRLFISHVSGEKLKATALKKALKEYAISGFVAHEDIHPTREWQHEIEKALFSMDSIACCLTPTFHESKWTDQEIGFALGRGILIVPIRIGMDPYGFFGKFQGIQAIGKRPSEIAKLVFEAICDNANTRSRMINIMVEQILSSISIDHALKLAEYLQAIKKVPSVSLERLRDHLDSNPMLASNEKFVDWLNSYLARNGLVSYSLSSGIVEEEADIPF